MKDHQHIIPPTMDEILNSMTNKELRVEVVDRLKKSTPIDDEVIGVKIFFESNHYDFNQLELFLQSSQWSIDNILTKNKSTKSEYGWLKVAVVIVPLIGISTYFLLNRGSKYDDLYSSYYEKELGLPVTLSDNDHKLFNESMNLFRNEDYKKSLQGFQTLLLTQPNNDTLHYFVGVCLLENGNVSESINEFSWDYKGSIFKEESQYRLVLSYLKNGDLKNSKEILLQITKIKEHPYYSQSKKLLEDKRFN